MIMQMIMAAKAIATIIQTQPKRKKERKKE